MLDEPFSALDTHLRFLMELVLRLRLEHFPGINIAYRCNELLSIQVEQVEAVKVGDT
ncbi:MAG: hypothetical protein AAGG02_01225 [Cyanobacteria bacterium P01_H01_bin.15]